jgi:membrane-associated protein
VGFDIEEFIKWAGLIGVFGVVFAESGLLVGIFLPGDSLLFTAGFLASQDIISLPALVIVCVLAAILGDATGYWFGRRIGRRLYERPDSRFFKQEHLRAVERLYEKHGGKAIILARFVPIVRTLAPVIAGSAAFDYRRFTAYNVLGGLGWGVGLTVGGYALGSSIPNPDRYLLPVVAVIILVSLLPSIIHLTLSNRELIRASLKQRRLPWRLEAEGPDVTTNK